MKKNTKKFITSIVALSMAFSSTAYISAAENNADIDAIVAAVDDTASGSAVSVGSDTVSTDDSTELLATADTFTASANTTAGQVVLDTSNVKIMAGNGTTTLTYGANGLKTDGTNDTIDSSAIESTTQGVMRVSFTVTPKVAGTVSVTGKITNAAGKGVGIATKSDGKLVELIAGANTAGETINLTTKLSKDTEYWIGGVGANLEIASITFTPSEEAGGGEEIPATPGTGAFTAEKTSYTAEKAGDTVEVKYSYTGDEVNNMTGFFNFDPSVVELKKVALSYTYKDESSGNDVTKSDIDLSDAISQKVDATIGGYTAEDAGKTEGELGKVKIAEYFLDDADINIGAKAVDVVLTFNAVKAGYSKVDFEKYIDTDGKGGFKTVKSVDVNVDVTNSEITVGSGAEASAGAGTFAPDKTEYTWTKDSKDNTVTFKYAGVPINNFTGFFEFDPKVVKITGITYKAGTFTGDFNDALTQEVDATIGGYSDSEKGTEADLGKVKVAQYFADAAGINGEADDLEITLTFDAVAEGKSDIKFTPYGKFKDAKSLAVDLTTTDGVINVTSGEETPLGSYEAVTKDTNLVLSEDGKTYNVGKDVDTFTVTFQAKDAFDANTVTATIEYDPTLVQPVESVTEGADGQSLFPAKVVADAIALTPSAANQDFTGLGADGTKTAAQLGKIKLVNVVSDSTDPDQISGNLNNLTFDAGEEVLTLKFKKVAGANGSTDITFNNVETLKVVDTSEGLVETVAANSVAKLNVTVESDPVANKYHLLGDLNFNGQLDAGDSGRALQYANLYPHTQLDNVIGRIVDEDFTAVTAVDASRILRVASSAGSTKFKDVSARTDIVDIENLEYIPVDNELIPDGFTSAGLVDKTDK